MNEQLSIPDTPRARAADPVTSHAAAAQVDLNARCAETLLAADRLATVADPYFTDRDLATETGMDRNVAARRRLDLQRKGLIEQSMVGNVAVERIENRRRVYVYMLTISGEDAIRGLRDG